MEMSAREVRSLAMRMMERAESAEQERQVWEAARMMLDSGLELSEQAVRAHLERQLQ